jgi:hypothetical protein
MRLLPENPAHFFLRGAQDLHTWVMGYRHFQKRSQFGGNARRFYGQPMRGDETPIEDKRIGSLFADLDLALDLGDIGEVCRQYSF